MGKSSFLRADSGVCGPVGFTYRRSGSAPSLQESVINHEPVGTSMELREQVLAPYIEWELFHTFSKDSVSAVLKYRCDSCTPFRLILTGFPIITCRGYIREKYHFIVKKLTDRFHWCTLFYIRTCL